MNRVTPITWSWYQSSAARWSIGVVADRVLPGREEVLGPAVVRRRRQAAVQVHDREARERGRVRVGGRRRSGRHALHRHAVGVGLGRRDRNDDGQRAVELVAPLDPDRQPALGLDRRTGHAAVEPPDPRRGQVAVKAMRRRRGSERSSRPSCSHANSRGGTGSGSTNGIKGDVSDTTITSSGHRSGRTAE